MSELISVADKSSWEKTPGGTTDWETVFEVPPTGLIPLITQAQSPSALRECTIVVIKKIYTRKNDPAEVERFISELTIMIPDDLTESDLPRITEAVSAILRRIKDDRIRKAAEFERSKALAPEPSAEPELAEEPDLSPALKKERRRPGPAVPLLLGPAKSRASLFWGLGAATAAAGAAVYFFVFVYGVPKEQHHNLVLIDQMKAVARGEDIKTHIFGGKFLVGTRDGRPFITAEEIPGDACLSASWVLLNHGTMIINDRMSRKMSPSVITGLCDLSGPKATITWLPKQDKKKG